MPGPFVSIVIPCYNHSRFLPDSVKASLAQTWPDLEIIIVDDGSTPEESKEVDAFAGPKTRVLHKKNGGLSSARNFGIANAAGKYILTLDADDVMESTFVEKAVALLEADGGLGLVTCRGRHFGERTGETKRKPCTLENILLGGACIAFCMFRKSDWELLGGYDETVELHEDFDFWLSMTELGRSAHRIDEILHSYRRHEDSIMSRAKLLQNKGEKSLSFQAHLKIFKKHKALFLRHPEVLAKALFVQDYKPKFAAFKKIKYKIILLLARIPGLRSLLARQAEKSRHRLEALTDI